MKIHDLAGMTNLELTSEVQCGGRFVCYQYCISIVILTFKRSSRIYLIRAGESAINKGLIYSLISLFFGWWGIPWGPIYTIQALVNNFQGGRDVTQEVATKVSQKS